MRTETTPRVELHPTACAICGTMDNAQELYPANFDLDAFNAEIFSARRLPDRIHYRLVRCKSCSLVRSDPVVTSDVLAQLYAQSTFDYGGETHGLQRTYGRALGQLDKHGVKKGALLEIGCGNGFFLEEARRRGYREVRGVEPSSAAIAAASPRVRDGIVCDMMRPGLFEAASFDVVCLFQVFDHIPDPNALLDECAHVLKPGGLLLFLNHNAGALSARLLGERSPIFDIEHTYLYDPTTLGKIAIKHGFKVREAGTVLNIYSLYYLSRLVPFPRIVKRALLNALKRSGLGRIQLPAPLGNQFLIAQKPKP